MPTCQVIGCSNKSGKGKSLFCIPDPTKSLDHKRQCQKWLKFLQIPSLNIKTFKAHPSKCVCEDHFNIDSFTGPYVNSVARSLNFVAKRKLLKSGAVPTLVNFTKGDDQDIHQHRISAESIAEKKVKAKLKDEIKQMRTATKAELLFEIVPEEVTPTTMAKENDDGMAMENDDLMAMDDDDLMAMDDDNLVVDQYEMETSNEPVSPMIHPQPELDPTDLLIATKIVQKPEVYIFDTEEGSSINTCGHPCTYCNISQTSMDHTYATSVKYVSVGTQTDPIVLDSESLEQTSNIDKFETCPTFSTPTRRVLPKKIRGINNSVENIRDISKESLFRDDSCDLTFTTEMVDSESDSETEFCEHTDHDNVNERKFIVFESCIDQLFKYICCPICRSSVCMEDTIRDTTEGSLLKCDLYCHQGHHILKWSSQPMLGKMPAGNLLFSASILFSGLSFTRVQQMASFLGLQMFSYTTFTAIQRNQLMPVVLHSWELMQEQILDRVKASGRALRLAGDGRCDSPGFSAKYCTYSLMELDSNEIVTFVVVSVTETDSSSKMEVEGFRRCIEMLLDRGFRIEVLATDRHVQIRSVLNKEKRFAGINHQFDVWHLAKSVKKKLTAKEKCKGAEELHDWIKAITNHLWWCASNCDGDADWLEECWVSVVNHTINVHEFEGDNIRSCPHEPLHKGFPAHQQSSI